MKVVVVGCTHAGTAAVVNIKENYPDRNLIAKCFFGIEL